jgi:replicative DNA helicase
MRLSRQFQIDRERIRIRLKELRRSVRTPRFNGPSENEPNFSATDLSKCDRKEAELVQILIQDPSMLDFVIENVPTSDFSEGPLRVIYELMEECFHEGKDVGYEQLMLELENPQLKAIIDQLYDEAIEKKEMLSTDSQAPELQLQSQMELIVLAFKNIVTESGKRNTISKMQEQKLDEDEETMALEELLKQTRQRQGL